MDRCDQLQYFTKVVNTFKEFTTLPPGQKEREREREGPTGREASWGTDFGLQGATYCRRGLPGRELELHVVWRTPSRNRQWLGQNNVEAMGILIGYGNID